MANNMCLCGAPCLNSFMSLPAVKTRQGCCADPCCRLQSHLCTWDLPPRLTNMLKGIPQNDPDPLPKAGQSRHHCVEKMTRADWGLLDAASKPNSHATGNGSHRQDGQQTECAEDLRLAGASHASRHKQLAVSTKTVTTSPQQGMGLGSWQYLRTGFRRRQNSCSAPRRISQPASSPKKQKPQAATAWISVHCY